MMDLAATCALMMVDCGRFCGGAEGAKAAFRRVGKAPLPAEAERTGSAGRHAGADAEGASGIARSGSGLLVVALAEKAVPQTDGRALGHGPLGERASARTHDSPHFTSMTGRKARFQLLLAAPAGRAGKNGWQIGL